MTQNIMERPVVDRGDISPAVLGTPNRTALALHMAIEAIAAAAEPDDGLTVAAVIREGSVVSRAWDRTDRSNEPHVLKVYPHARGVDPVLSFEAGDSQDGPIMVDGDGNLHGINAEPVDTLRDLLDGETVTPEVLALFSTATRVMERSGRLSDGRVQVPGQ